MATDDERKSPLPGGLPGGAAGPASPSKSDGEAPRLPVRASIYIDPDGTVHFGALFDGLVSVADALGNRRGGGHARAGDEDAPEGADEP